MKMDFKLSIALLLLWNSRVISKLQLQTFACFYRHGELIFLRIMPFMDSMVFSKSASSLEVLEEI